MPGRRDDLARAYATLGISPQSSLAEATRTYKKLVVRWHPDQYANDPQGQAEAALRLREINHAFGLIRERAGEGKSGFSAAGVPPTKPEPPRPPAAGGQPTKAEREQIVDAIDTAGDAALLGHILFWGLALGLAFLLIGQPGQAGRRNGNNTAAGIVLLAAAAGYEVVRLWRRRG